MARRGAARRTAVAGVALVVLATAAPASAADGLDLDGFVARIDAALAVARAGVQRPAPQAMDRVREALGLPALVDAGPEVVALPEDPFLAGLDGSDRADFERAVTHLSALRATAREGFGEPIEPAAVRRSVDEASRGLDVEPGLGERLRRAFQDAVAWLVFRLHLLGGVATALLVALGLLIVGAVLLLLRRGRIVPERRVAGPRSGEVRDVDWDREAADALARGDLRAAVRARYGALLAALAGRDLVRDAPSVTAGECRAAVHAARPALDPVVGTATLAFERVFYGRADAAPADVDALRRAEDAARST